MPRWYDAVLAIALLGVDSAYAEKQLDGLRLDTISIQLFYQTTGSLSRNIAPPAKFHAWNTIIAEGDAREPARDMLVTARLTSKKDEANSSTPMTLSVTGKDGKILAQRTFNHIFFERGHSIQALFVPDSTCAGHIVVEAIFGNAKKTVALDLNCGE
jgi:hypothetical protein